MELPTGNIFFDISSPSEQILRSGKLKRPLMTTVIEELAILGLVLLVFFFPIPTAFMPFTAIPIAVIVALVPVLGGIAVAIGLMIDAIVLVFRPSRKQLENKDERARPGDVRGALISAVKRINRPSFFVVVAIAISFLPIFAPQDKLDARVMEVTRKQPEQLVWELYVSGQESYRTVHLPSLYPEVQW